MTDSNDMDGRPSGRARGRADAPVATDAGAPEAADERIAKVIARAGVASRRDAEAMIAAGRVTVDGETIASPALNVGPGARITVDGEPLPSRERTRLWLFHKPRGLVTTARDPEGRQTVFETLPDDLPRVVAVGRLDINTEGLLLLTNDGGLAKVIAHPETGWTRRYRVRARGEVDQAQLDRLRHGVTVDGMEYGAIEAVLDRVQGENAWMTLALREGKNREVKRVLEHLGLQVNRLIRLSFGPFQLGELESGLVEEVRTRVLKDQLGQALAAEAGVDFESPVREPIAPFGSPKAAAAAPRAPRTTAPRPRRAEGEDRFKPGRSGERDGPGRSFGPRPDRAPRGARPDRGAPSGDAPRPRSARDGRAPVWRGEDEENRPAKRHDRREDPRADRAVAGARQRERVGAVESGEGRRVLVERVRRTDPDEAAPREWPARERPARERPARSERPSPGQWERSGDGGDRPRPPGRFPPNGGGRGGDDRPGRGRGAPGGGKPPGRPFGKPGRPFDKPGRPFGAAGRFEGKPDRPDGRPGRPPGKPAGAGFGGRPAGPGFAGKPRGGPGARSFGGPSGGPPKGGRSGGPPGGGKGGGRPFGGGGGGPRGRGGPRPGGRPG